MKKTLLYIAALLGVTAFSACDDDFARPPMVLPETVEVEANYSIPQVKNRYWANMSTPTNIGVSASTGDSMVFKGRVCSSDESGNIFKKIYVQSRNENGDQVAIAFYVNAKEMYAQFPFGQEVAVYGTGLTIGSASGVLAFGDPADKDFYMTEERFYSHIYRTGIGVPDPTKVDTTATTLAHIDEIKSISDSVKVWQCRLVRIDGCSWVEAGQPYSDQQYGTNRYITDAEGHRLMVRNSTFTDYADQPLPYGTGSVVGILSQFNGSLQLTMIDKAGSIGFDDIAPEPGPEVDPAGEGTEASPYNVTKALEVATALKDGEETAEVYVAGVISAIKEVSTQYGNAEYTIVDEGGSKTIGVFRGYWLGGERFTAEDQIKIGGKVVVKGKLVNYKGNTPQLAQGNQLVSYDGQTAGGDTPTPPTPSEGQLYNYLGENLAEMPADWTIDNVNLGTAEYVWSWKVYNSKGYLNASAYVNNTAIATEAYAISPVIDLTGATECSMSFDHAAKFQTTLRTLCGLVVREEGANEWTSLAVPTWPEAGAWTFVNSGNISLAAYDGKKIQIAFKYGSSADGADTWEIKNLAINGKK